MLLESDIKQFRTAFKKKLVDDGSSKTKRQNEKLIMPLKSFFTKVSLVLFQISQKHQKTHNILMTILFYLWLTLVLAIFNTRIKNVFFI